MRKKTKKWIALILVLIAVLISPMILFRGCIIYVHETPFLTANPEVLDIKTITICSKESSNEQNFAMALRKKGFLIVPYSDVKSIAPAEFDKRGSRGGLERDWLPPEVIEKAKKELGVDAILYEWSRAARYLGMWAGHCEMSLIDIETGGTLAGSSLDTTGAFSEQGALDKIAKKTVNMMIKSAKSGKYWDWGDRPQWQKRYEE